jgi:hypothetical protein
MLKTRYFSPILMKPEFLEKFSKNTQISNFMKILPLVAKLLHAVRRMNGQISGHTLGN